MYCNYFGWKPSKEQMFIILDALTGSMGENILIITCNNVYFCSVQIMMTYFQPKQSMQYDEQVKCLTHIDF